MENTLASASKLRTTHQNATSRLMLVALAALVLMVLVATLAARLTGFTADSVADTPIVQTRELGFRDLPGGKVSAYEWNSDFTLLVVNAGEGSFLRGVVRSLVRQRAGLSPDLRVPFHLNRHSDGRMVLLDPATGERIDLIAFGPDNYRVFATLLDTPIRSESISTSHESRW